MNGIWLCVIGGFVIAVITVWISGCLEFRSEPPKLGQFIYPAGFVSSVCPLGERAGPGGISNDEQTESGIKYAVRTPNNYDPSHPHPLLMVYAPAESSRFRSERFTDLTFEATRVGFIVAYADSRRLSLEMISELGTIPGLIAEKWCVDEKRVYMTGHSDGGTVSLALALMDETRHIPTAVAPSAAGFRTSDLKPFSCPTNMSAMIMHGANDRLFPGYGAEISTWLAACNECQITREGENGCQRYAHCPPDGEVIYCVGSGGHTQWPAINTTLLSFFLDVDSRVH